MLIEFSVANFKSFRERQTLSMAAVPRLRKRDCLITPDVIGEKLPDLLKVVAIYGPNASGKSSLLRAIDVIQSMSRREPSAEFRKLPASPFRFDKNLDKKPSSFEVHFIYERQRYQFDLSITEDRVVEERLIAYPKGVETLLFERFYQNDVEIFRMGEKLEGTPELHLTWQQLTSPQVLFINRAVANSNAQLQQLRGPLKWLQAEFSVIHDFEMASWGRMLQAFGSAMPNLQANVSKYLQDVDVPVTSIKFDNGVVVEEVVKFDENNRDEVIEKARQIYKNRQEVKTTLTHRTLLGEAEFDISEESSGTQNLLSFYMPWAVIDQHLVAVDEFDSSLHPKLVEALVTKFLKTSGRGQLIFTTHDTHLMDAKLLRRDQFWLTERNANGATRLRSVYDFEGREGEAIERRYYKGHYRALPELSDIVEKVTDDGEEA